MINPRTIIKIQLLQGSNAKNYLESKERLFLQTILLKIQNTKEPHISNNEEKMLEDLFKKYDKFL